MPKRNVSPFEFGKPVIEAISQPLYDQITIDDAALATPYQFFTAPAGKNSRQILPDIIQGGQLSHPKIHVVWSFRLVFSEEGSQDTANYIDWELADVRNILWNSWYRFHVGVKDYLTVPTFAIPAGMGMTGFLDGFSTPVGWVQNNNNGFFGCQRSINNRRITIPPQQNFFGELNTVDNATAPTHDLEVWNFLEGEFGREVM